LKIKDISREVALKLGDLDQPVVTDYQLALIVVDVLSRIPHKHLTKKKFWEVARALSENGIITPHKDFPGSKVFSIIGKKSFDPGDVICAIDPFCYVSHLNAMSYHGLSDRIPSVLIISSPASKEWKPFAIAKMEKDLGDRTEEYFENRLPLLQKIRLNKIGKHPIVKYSSIHLGAFKVIKDRTFRVSSIGRTFLDMVREPRLCGGMSHVVEIYKKYGRQYKRLIIDEVDRNGNSIEKSRVGYLLEEVCNIADDKFIVWAKSVQRGGSRKLDPHEEYSSSYSEKWCISINILSPTEDE
jgi:hypothetical protein